MKNNEYIPYLCRDDAIEEYKTLRAEIFESQKQRINLFQYTLIFLAALFGYFFRDKGIGVYEALFLVVFSIPASLFSYSTRCRERRIATYMKIFMKKLTPWSGVSSIGSTLKFFERTSTAIVLAMLLINAVILFLSFPGNLSQFCGSQIVWYFAIAISLFNVFILYKTAKLPDYTSGIQKSFNEYTKTKSTEQVI